MVRRARCLAPAMALLALAVMPAAAEDRNAQSEVQGQYDIGGMINQAVRNISARYNLNQEQNQVTQRMMEEGVSNFLAQHADEIYPLIRDLTRAKLNGHNLTEAERRRIGQAAKPLVDAARAEILRYNAEWGNILSPEQKRLHEWDLREMEGQFELIHENFEKMKQGEAVDNPIFPAPKVKTEEPPRPSQPLEGTIPYVPPMVEKAPKEEDVFESYVRKFIEDYKLDAAQKATALSILKEYKAFADAYRKVKKDDFERVQKSAEQARNDHAIEKLKAAEKELDQLNQRITQLFEEMKQRLGKIPRESQKRAYEHQADEKPADKAAPASPPSTEQGAPKQEAEKTEPSARPPQ